MTLALGHKSVSDCQRWVSSLEFAEWMAYAQLEPFGNDQVLGDAHFANLMALLANINRAKKSRTYKSEDFQLLEMEKYQDQKDLKSSRVVYAGFRAMALATQEGENG